MKEEKKMSEPEMEKLDMEGLGEVTGGVIAMVSCKNCGKSIPLVYAAMNGGLCGECREMQPDGFPKLQK